ncbi:MAG: hypothetical protein IPN97_14605 [Saprospiraceae bacterium]|nr:hypothetical protein [Saprospiraceae bacterium]
MMGQYAISTFAWWIFFILVNRNYNETEQGVSQVMRNLFGLSGILHGRLVHPPTRSSVILSGREKSTKSGELYSG